MTSSTSPAETLVDARGHRCPVPTLKLRRALESQAEVLLLADDPMAQIDVPHFCQQNNHVLVSSDPRDGHWAFHVKSAP